MNWHGPTVAKWKSMTFESWVRVKNLCPLQTWTTETIWNKDFVQIILQSLPGSYQSFIRGLDTADKLKSIKSEELCAKLVQEEKRQVKEKESFDGESQAFVMKWKKWKLAVVWLKI